MRPFWRRDPLAALGTGVWRRAHDRFHRAVDRYHQMIDAVEDGPVRDGLEVQGARLAAALDDVLAVCLAAQERWPSASLEIPGAGDVVHRAVSQAATSAAQASEAATMARVEARAGHEALALQRIDAVRRSVDAVTERVASAAG